MEWCRAKILRRAHSAPSHRVINRAERERERDKDRGACAESQPLLYIISILFHTLILIPSLFCPFLIYMCLVSRFCQTVPLFLQLTRTGGHASHSTDIWVKSTPLIPIRHQCHHHSSSYYWIHTGFPQAGRGLQTNFNKTRIRLKVFNSPCGEETPISNYQQPARRHVCVFDLFKPKCFSQSIFLHLILWTPSCCTTSFYPLGKQCVCGWHKIACQYHPKFPLLLLAMTSRNADLLLLCRPGSVCISKVNKPCWQSTDSSYLHSGIPWCRQTGQQSMTKMRRSTIWKLLSNSLRIHSLSV